LITAPGVQTTISRLSLTISSADAAATGLWAYDGNGLTMTRLNGLPSNPIVSMEWTPDNSGILLTIPGTAQATGNILYVPANGGASFSLVSWLGYRIADFHWLNPR
jgi:hypothetical protein